MRGKKDATTFPDKPVFVNRFTLQGFNLIISIYIYIRSLANNTVGINIFDDASERIRN